MLVNEDQFRLERHSQVWFIPFVDKRVGGSNPLATRAIPERFCDEVQLCIFAFYNGQLTEYGALICPRWRIQYIRALAP